MIFCGVKRRHVVILVEIGVMDKSHAVFVLKIIEFFMHKTGDNDDIVYPGFF